MITLKHLARDLDWDPYRLRMALRAANLSPPANRRWRWPDANDPHYKKCRKVALKKGSSDTQPSPTG